MNVFSRCDCPPSWTENSCHLQGSAFHTGTVYVRAVWVYFYVYVHFCTDSPSLYKHICVCVFFHRSCLVLPESVCIPEFTCECMCARLMCVCLSGRSMFLYAVCACMREGMCTRVHA